MTQSKSFIRGFGIDSVSGGISFPYFLVITSWSKPTSVNRPIATTSDRFHLRGFRHVRPRWTRARSATQEGNHYWRRVWGRCYGLPTENKAALYRLLCTGTPVGHRRHLVDQHLPGYSL